MFGLMARAKKEEHQPPAACCMGVDVPDSPFLNANRVARINAGRYEEQEIIGALRVVRAGDTVLELGAGLGIVGAVVARNMRPARVMSYEANPDLIPHIEALYTRNKLTDRISVENRILWAGADRPEEVTLHVTNSFLGASVIERQNRATRPVAVQTADFNRVVAKADVLIMDIEGAELDILRSADLSRLRAMVLEFHPEAYGVEGMREAKAIVRDAGFQRIAPCSSRTVWACEKVYEG
ncbi:FkbM family methyltransferase [Pseudooceanicola sp.]|uniref:FkbM family methyltransferase n=1 Tax=Pseudooceanicola sp. TaxID=1914328 RepID=UPI0026316FBD|nr:FkbM family methyltransferase [Pseudooceanicola sp.]MDF1854371.1 FkbM family methyltransferase [Pseudooceanicola sp.]